MSTYLDLTNKVIYESGTELDELTSVSWYLPEAGRRQYPRIKRAVSDAWKTIQMERNEWEFKDEQYSGIVYPRIRITEGERLAGPPPLGTVFRGQDSGFQFTLSRLITIDGDWTLATANAQMEFTVADVGNQLTPGEVFTEVTPVLNNGAFTYLEKGSYNFSQDNPLLREILWTTMVASQENAVAVPVWYIPWDNWLYKELSFVQGSRSVPNFASQDYKGDVVFYPQTLDPFRISFVHTTAPQVLLENDDDSEVPFLLQEEYHDWIAWRAVMSLAMFNKNPTLYTYGKQNADLYKNRAERNLMPIPTWGRSRYSYQRRP